MLDDKNIHMDWFKIHHNGWLEGTLRYQPNIDQVKLAAFRGIMADLCSLVSRSRLRDGTLRHQVGLPMTRDRIAQVLNIPIDLLNEFINFGKKDINPIRKESMVKEWEDGTIELTGWEVYQAKTGKSVAQKVAIEKAKKTRNSLNNNVIGLTRAVNETTKATKSVEKKIKYIETGKGDIVDTTSGEIIK